MRIGLITGEYPPDRGGVGDFTFRLGRALTERKHRVHVITSTDKRNTAAEAASGSSGSHVTVHPVVKRWRVGCWRQILTISRELELDILNIQYQAAAYDMRPGINLIPRGRDVGVVATFHDLRVPYLFPKAGPLRRFVVNRLAQRADGVIATNREDELRLSRLNPPISHVTRIPIGSNITMSVPRQYSRGEERARWGVAPDDLLIGYFGFLSETKGAEDLIAALGMLVEWGVEAHLLKIGGSVGSSDPSNRAYAERVQQLIANLGLQSRVHMTGFIAPEEVSASLVAVDVCALPYRDGVSFRRGSLLACLAHGRAVVTTTPALPLPEVEDGFNMLLVDPESPRELAQALSHIGQNPTLRERLEEGAGRLAAQFTWKEIARQTEAFFSETMAEAT